MEKGKEALSTLHVDEGLTKDHDSLRLHVRIKEVLKERNITQKELAELTGIRPAAISELANNLRTTINREHIERIAEVLEITRIDDLIRFELESELWTMAGRKDQQAILDEDLTKE